jgi:hypothetical protein
MDELKEARILSDKAEVYSNEGNYEYVIRCYEKIILILKKVAKKIDKAE